MPSIPRRGKSILYVEMEPDLKARVEALASTRGNTLAQEVREALRRHTDFPPTTSAPGPTAPPARTRKRVAKES